MHDPPCVQVLEREANLGDVELDDVLLQATEAVEVKAKVTTEHEVEDHEEVFVVLEREAQVAHERRVNLLKQSPFLDDLVTLRSGELIIDLCTGSPYVVDGALF